MEIIKKSRDNQEYQKYSERGLIVMIDFDEELKKFTPSEEVDAETIKADPEQIKDMADVLMQLLKD